MKKFTSLLIACSLALAGAAYAQQPEEQSTPGAGKKEKTEKAEPKARGGNAATSEATAKPGPTGLKERGAGSANEVAPGKGRKVQPMEKSATGTGTETGVSAQTGGTATTETGAGKGRKGKAKTEAAASTGADVSTQPSAAATTPPNVKHQGHEKGMKAGANAKTSASAAPSVAASASAAPSVAASASAAPSVAASASAAPSVAASASAAPSVAATGATGQLNAGANATGGTVKVDKQKVQEVKQQSAQIKQQHVNFRAQPRPDRVPAVTFTQGYRIQGSDRWQGPQYEVYRSYHPERHDRGWYSSRYNRVELIGGGYYYWNNGYWYPAWGYDSGNEYYAYDAPIYVGHRAEPPDRVIADVQAELQQMGYYRGEVDGLLGPLTREALTAYQADQGLMTTAVIDQPTLDSLNLG
jgi:hypothetical protein